MTSLLVWEIAGAVVGVSIATALGYLASRTVHPDLLRANMLLNTVTLAYTMIELGVGFAFIGQVMGSTSPHQIGGVLPVTFLAWSVLGVAVSVPILVRSLLKLRRL